MAHLLFLSHAGADTERALRLAAAIEASLEAQVAGLRSMAAPAKMGLAIERQQESTMHDARY